MSYYGCGHNRKTVIMSTSVFTLANYFVWVNGRGSLERREECHDCFAEKVWKSTKEVGE